MRLFDSWKDFCDYMDFKGYFLDMFLGLIYWGVIGFNVFYGVSVYAKGARTLPIALWVAAGILVLLIPLIQLWFRKKHGKKFDID